MLGKIIEDLRNFVTGAPTTGAERRRHARYSCDCPSNAYIREIGSDDTRLPGSIRNISVSGCLFKPKMDISKLQFGETARGSLSLVGGSVDFKIVRCSYAGIHCAFTENLGEEGLRRMLSKYGVRR